MHVMDWRLNELLNNDRVSVIRNAMTPPYEVTIMGCVCGFNRLNKNLESREFTGHQWIICTKGN